MTPSMGRWKGKVAIVTGASSGIGAAIAESLVDSGLKVVGLDRRKVKLEELTNKLQGKKGKLYPIKADMTQGEDILEVFKWVKENLGCVYILINNAGIAKGAKLIDGATKEWKEILDTNVLGLSIATREAVKDMRANNVDGHIIHINSVAGHQVSTILTLSLYTASKYAVTALTETLKQELNSIGSKIKITSISPGVVATDIWPTKFIQEFKFPQLQSEDVADAVIYALSTPPHVQVRELTIKPVGELN